MATFEKFAVDVLDEPSPEDDGSFRLITEIDCADLDAVKKRFGEETYKMALRAAGMTEKKKQRPLPVITGDEYISYASLVELVNSTQEEARQPQKRNICLPRKRDTSAMASDELKEYVNTLYEQLEKLHDKQAQLEKFSKDCCTNLELFINSLPRRGCDFISGVYVVKETDVQSVSTSADDEATFEKKIDFVPCTLGQKKKSSVGYVVSKPTVYFTDSVTRISLQVSCQRRCRNETDKNSFWINIKKPKKELVGGVVRWYYYYKPQTNQYLNDFISSYNSRIVPFQEMVNSLSKLKEKLGSIDEQGDGGQTLMHSACFSGNNEMVSWLLKNNANLLVQDDFGWTPLITAVSQHKYSTALMLLDSGRPCGVNLLSAINSIALNYLCDSKPCEALEQHQKVLKALLEKGSNPYQRNDRGCTPIHSAVSSGNMDAVVELLKYVKKTDVVDGDGLTPLHTAVSSEQCDIRIVNALLGAGFSPNAASPIGTPLQVALSKKHIGAFKYMLTKIHICYLGSISDSTLVNVLKYLPPKECLKVRCASKRFHSVVTQALNSDEYWNVQQNSSMRRVYRAISNGALNWFFIDDTKRKATASGGNVVYRDADIAIRIALLGKEKSGRATLMQMFNETPSVFTKNADDSKKAINQHTGLSCCRVVGLCGKLVKVTLTKSGLNSDSKIELGRVESNAVILAVDLSDSRFSNSCEEGIAMYKKSFKKNKVPLLILGTKADVQHYTMNSAQLLQNGVCYREVRKDDLLGFHEVIREFCNEVVRNILNSKK